MNRKHILANIWKFSVTKSVAIMLMIPTVGSLVILGAFYLYLDQTKDDVLFTNIAGRQRMLSEQLGSYVIKVHDLGQEEDREPLREIVATFEQSLVTLDQGGEIMGLKLSPAPPVARDKIILVKELWQDIKSALLIVADQPTSSPQAVQAYDFIQVSIPRLLDLSDEVVINFKLLKRNQKDQIFKVLITVLSINFVLLFTGVLITKRYLADQKQTKETLRGSEEKYRGVFENATEGIFQTTLEGRYILANPAMTRIYGYVTPEELIGLNRQFYIQPDRRAELIHQIKDLGFVTEFESQVYRKDRSIIWISENAHGIRDAEGNLTGYEGITVDITERKQADEKVKKLSEAVEQSSDMVFITDIKGNIEFVNAAFTEITGYNAEEALGKNPSILKSGKMSDKYYKMVWETILSGKPIRAECINKNKNGELIICDQTITP